eukprot:CAMPEP_0119371470 /NCGR_PEP_ID=MMETSP1334-20130426/17626_1 /TAXON_ID=127549 /ORGANISM="Calcidiscus leptoporus, Strain RCC1130" /LENGTH=95 /DNA_ID=CAMNT_0007388745 /DNA_START=407 /DNA_END=690 /DNA_ORIENTATION=+
MTSHKEAGSECVHFIEPQLAVAIPHVVAPLPQFDDERVTHARHHCRDVVHAFAPEEHRVAAFELVHDRLAVLPRHQLPAVDVVGVDQKGAQSEGG